MARKVIKDQPNKEKIIILLESLGYDVDKFKFEKYKENKSDPQLCKKLSGTYAEMCKAQTMASVTTLEDYDKVNPFYYHNDWKSKIQYIEDAKSSHINHNKSRNISNFRELHALDAPREVKESIVKNTFNIWTKEHESDIEVRKHYYDTIIDSIDNRKLKGGLLRIKDIMYIIFLVFAVLAVTSPRTIPTFFGLLPQFQNFAVSINESMITSPFTTSVAIIAIYAMSFSVIATIFFGLTKKEYYNTFRNKKKSKKRFDRAIQVAEIKQRAAISAYIKNFVNSKECPSTPITDIVLVQNEINGYDYYYSEMRNRYGWMEQHGRTVSFILANIRLISLIVILMMFAII